MDPAHPTSGDERDPRTEPPPVEPLGPEERSTRRIERIVFLAMFGVTAGFWAVRELLKLLGYH